MAREADVADRVAFKVSSPSASFNNQAELRPDQEKGQKVSQRRFKDRPITQL